MSGTLLASGEFWLAIAAGLPVTLALTALAMAFGLALGTLNALLMTEGGRSGRAAGEVFVFLFRSISLLTLLYFLYYGLPRIDAVRHGPLWQPLLKHAFVIAVIGFSLNNAAYLSEVMRGAIRAVPKGQVEAAISHGMRRRLRIRRIVLPLALRNAFLTIANEAVFTLKATSLASAITVSDILSRATAAGKTHLDVLTPYVAVAAVYVLLVMALDRIVIRMRQRTFRTSVRID